jgi:hypothetical protein
MVDDFDRQFQGLVGSIDRQEDWDLSEDLVT